MVPWIIFKSKTSSVLDPKLGPILGPILGPTLGPILVPILGPILGPSARARRLREHPKKKAAYVAGWPHK